MLQDIQYALRTLAKAPGFTLAAVLSLALGLGANTAIFSVTSALLLHPLPYQDSDRLAILWNRSPGLNIAEDWFSTAQYFDIRNSHHGFADLAIAIGANYNLTGSGEPERVGTIRISSNLLPMLGVQPLMGRLFRSEEDRQAATTALLSHGTWMRRYGGDPNALGKSITLNGQSYQIVGILPESFSLPREVLPTLGGAENAEVILPLPMDAAAPNTRTHEDYNIIGKLKPGVSLAQAQAEMDMISARLCREHPDFYPPNSGLTFSIVPLFEQVVGGVRRSLWMLAAAVGLVLLIACANVASLLLSRALGRQKEIAVRAILGATRGRIVRQLLTESVLLALLGGILGLVLAGAAVQYLRYAQPVGIPRVGYVGLNWEVAAFAFAVSLLSGVLFGLVPALRLDRLGLGESVRQAGRGASGTDSVWSRGQNTRRLLVSGELALCVILSIGAGLLLRSLAALQSVPPGFDPKGVLTLGLTMSGRKYATPAVVGQTYRQLWDKLEQIPGVAAVGGISALPLSQMYSWGPITIEGRTPPAGESFINADERFAARRYFEAMRIPLLQGRLFNEHDTPDAPRVAVIDEWMARQFWPNQDAVGKRFHTGGVSSKSPWTTVVGVVGRVKQYTLDSDSRIALYLPHTQYPLREMNVVVRARGDVTTAVPAVKSIIREIDPDLPIYQLKLMTERVEESLARRRFATRMLSLFAGLALSLAMIGVYGLMAYLVTQGTREIGIRIALGATRQAITGMILKQALIVVVPGVAIGLCGAIVLNRSLQSLLFGVTATEPLTLGGVSLLLGLMALLATYLPARRAAAVDPMVSLRAE